MFQRFIVGCICLVLFSTCKKNKEENLIVNIEDDFYIDLFEDISNGEKRFQMDVATIHDQACLNFNIDYSLDFDEQINTIDLTLNNLVEPEHCIEGEAPAEVVIPFGTINPGTYSFNISLKDAVVNNGRLLVFADRFQLEMDSDDGIEIVNEQLYRIPGKTIWGYVGYSSTEDMDDAERFINDLEGLSSVFDIENNNLYKSGYYGYFRISDEKDLVLSGEINQNYYLPFIFQHDSENLAEINSVLDNACFNNQALDIHIYTDNGQELICN